MPNARNITREMILKHQVLKEFYVFESQVTSDMVEGLRQVVKNRKSQERHIQRYLADHPEILAQWAGGGHGRWVIPQKRLGAEHVPDFVVGEKNSGGYFWKVVELESANAKMHTLAGNPSATLTHAIRQIQDWRAWLGRNRDYASRPRGENGLGLRDIRSTIPGLILIGRRADLDPSWNDLRRQMQDDLRIEIHTYDWLANIAEARASHWEGYYSQFKSKVAKDGR